MASRVPIPNVTLPSIRTIFPPSTFSPPSFSPSSDDEMPFMPLKEKKPLSHDVSNHAPRMALPLPTPRHANHNRRVSTASNYSVPSLTHSPSPSPSPSPSIPCTRHVRLVPCALQVADVVVVATHSLSSHSPSSGNSHTSSPESLGPRATLLVGPAISRAAKDDRKMHPYRVVRDRRA